MCCLLACLRIVCWCAMGRATGVSWWHGPEQCNIGVGIIIFNHAQDCFIDLSSPSNATFLPSLHSWLDNARRFLQTFITCYWCHFFLGHCPFPMQYWRRYNHMFNSSTPKCITAGTNNSRSEDFLLAKRTSRKYLRKGLDEAATDGFRIKLWSKWEINLFTLPRCKLQQSLARRRQW